MSCMLSDIFGADAVTVWSPNDNVMEPSSLNAVGQVAPAAITVRYGDTVLPLTVLFVHWNAKCVKQCVVEVRLSLIHI